MSSPNRSSRLAVLDAVRRGHHSVNALAQHLGVTDNAVRLHLTALERDGLLGRTLAPPSGRVGQPAAHYAITADGELALSRAYPAALTALVAALGERLDARALRAVFVAAGRRLAAGEARPAAGPLAQRAEACATLLHAMGGSVTVQLGRREAILTGDGCPLAAAVRAEPATCSLVEGLLEEYGGLDAVQRCEHAGQPRCRFHLTARA